MWANKVHEIPSQWKNLGVEVCACHLCCGEKLKTGIKRDPVSKITRKKGWRHGSSSRTPALQV
jgi:hypothetical protein